MDYIVEIITLSVDSIVLLTCLKQYHNKKKDIERLYSAQTVTLDKNLKNVLQSTTESKLPYIAIRGVIKPLGSPIISNNNPQVSGVVQSLKIEEHVVQRSSTGFWSNSSRVIQEVHNVIPFALENKGVQVEVMDPLVAEYLDMDVISDTFHPTVPSMMDHIWGFFSGYRQRGIQSTEKMLRQGTILTGIGELALEDNSFKIQPPSNGTYYLTSLPVPSLIKKIESSKHNYKIISIICLVVGMGATGFLLRKYYNKKREKKEQEDKKQRLEATRKKRRKQIRDTSDVPQNQICVVCRTNPIEIILLPCGHVCLCEDCADDIVGQCPMCRTTIDKKQAAYI